ncbi:MAG: hypothetical protein AB7Q45_21595, partial [Planctomycetaceae bacterium]
DVHARLSFFDPERGWRDVGETRVDPRADRRPPHQALTAPCGGPLPAEAAAGPVGDEFRLLAPRFNVTGRLDSAASECLMPGQVVSCRLSIAPRPLSDLLRSRVAAWFRERTQRINL